MMRTSPRRAWMTIIPAYVLFSAAPSCSCDQPQYIAQYVELETDAGGLTSGAHADLLATMTVFDQPLDGSAFLYGGINKDEDAWIRFAGGESLNRGCSNTCDEFEDPYRTSYRITDMSPQFGDWSDGTADYSGANLTVRWTDSAGERQVATWYVPGGDFYIDTGPADTGTAAD